MSKNFVQLLSRIKSKKVKIAVIGQGYVGLPLALAFAKRGFHVLGYDNDNLKIKQLKKHKTYINDIKSEDLKNKNFYPISDVKKLKYSDIIIVCLPTPLKRNTKTPDMKYIKNFSKILGNFLNENQVIILESTTYPGTTEEFFLPIIKKKKLVPGKNVFLVYSPERVDPGNKKFNIFNTPKIISGLTENCKKIGSALYGSIVQKTIETLNLKHAEMIKLYENIFRSINIGLVNEMKIISLKLGLDIFEIIRCASTKPYGFMPFYPGPGYGGHCIPIDPHYLSWLCKRYNYQTKFIELSSKINDRMPAFVVNNLNKQMKKINKLKKNILILGLGYKKNIDDIRESPSVQIINILTKKKNYNLQFYDSFIKTIVTRNKKFKNLKRFNLNYKKLKIFDAVVLVTDHDDLNYDKIFKYSNLIIDTRGRYSKIKSTKIIHS